MPYTTPSSKNANDTLFATDWNAARQGLIDLQNGKAEAGGAAGQAFQASELTEGGQPLSTKYQAAGSYQKEGFVAINPVEVSANGDLPSYMTIVDTSGGAKTMTLKNGAVGQQMWVFKKGGDANALSVQPYTGTTTGLLPKVNGGTAAVSSSSAYALILLTCVATDMQYAYWVAKVL